MRELQYNRPKVLEYARKRAYSRNPKYYNFDAVGGDCTSFASQCVYAGSNIMNYTKNTGWYYINGNDKSLSWSGVEYFYNFLVGNKGVGPHGREARQEELELGDIIQLSFDSFNKRVTEYLYENVRFVHIEGVRNY